MDPKRVSPTQGILRGRGPTERTVRPDGVVVNAPRFDRDLRVRHAHEPALRVRPAHAGPSSTTIVYGGPDSTRWSVRRAAADGIRTRTPCSGTDRSPAQARCFRAAPATWPESHHQCCETPRQTKGPVRPGAFRTAQLPAAHVGRDTAIRHRTSTPATSGRYGLAVAAPPATL